MRHELGGHIVPLAGEVHGGGGRGPRPMAKGDVCHGAGSLPGWRDREVSSHRMLTARASCSPAVSLGIQRPRSRAAACSACSPGRLASPSKRA